MLPVRANFNCFLTSPSEHLSFWQICSNCAQYSVHPLSLHVAGPMTINPGCNACTVCSNSKLHFSELEALQTNLQPCCSNGLAAQHQELPVCNSSQGAYPFAVGVTSMMPCCSSSTPCPEVRGPAGAPVPAWCSGNCFGLLCTACDCKPKHTGGEFRILLRHIITRACVIPLGWIHLRRLSTAVLSRVSLVSPFSLREDMQGQALILLPVALQGLFHLYHLQHCTLCQKTVKHKRSQRRHAAVVDMSIVIFSVCWHCYADS